MAGKFQSLKIKGIYSEYLKKKSDLNEIDHFNQKSGASPNDKTHCWREF
jgi:hypothetical protein